LEKLAAAKTLDVDVENGAELLDAILPDLDAAAGAAPPPVPPPPSPPRKVPPKAAPAKAAEFDTADSDKATASSFDTPALQLQTDAPAKESGGAAVYSHRRAKKSKLPLIIGLAVVALVVLVAVGGGIGWTMLQGSRSVAQQDNEPRDSEKNTAVVPPAAAGDVTNNEPSSDNPFALEGEPANWETQRLSIVTINVIGGMETRSGVGVLVGDDLVATDAQLVSEADGAVVTLADGRRFEASGVLSRPQTSLALLRLDANGSELPALALVAATVAPQTPVFIGDEQGAVATKVLRRLSVDELPAALRPNVPPEMRENTELQLLEHEGRTGKLADGRTYETPSGAPLLDGDGRIVGLNLALGGDSRKGYAVGSAELTQLVDDSRSADFRPLSGDAVASVKPSPIDEVDPLQPFDPPPAENSLEGRLETFALRHKQLAEKNWQPENAADYLAFATFAHEATELTAMIDSLEGDAQDAPRAKIMEAIEALADAPWPSADEMAAVNKLAFDDLRNPDSLGVFAYARCILGPESFGDAVVNGSPIFAFELPGTDGLIVLPIGENGAEVSVGSEWLIMGTKDLTQGIRMTTPTSPDEPRDAAIVHAKYILERPKAM
jgi:S1-C subfamily serine protease